MSDSPKPIEVPRPLAQSETESNEKLSPTSPDFKYDSLPLEILEHLVNNDYLADVVFKVGESGTLMYAHKNIITLASEVFFTQFNGQFSEAKQDSHVQPIVITDIEPSTMLEVLRHVYCRQVSLTADNMLDVYYAAMKYMLESLQILCEAAFYREIDDDNVLRIFKNNGHYRFDIVDELCLRLICDNPLKFFKHNDFVELDSAALHMIVEKQNMNCHDSELEDAVAQWEDCNEKTDIIVGPRVRLCRKLHFFGMPGYSSYRYSEIRLNVESKIALYGVGIFVGVQYDHFVSGSSVTVRVKVNQQLMATKFMNMSEDLQTCELMFEKVIFDVSCTMQVILKTSNDLRYVNMFFLSALTPADNLGSAQLTVENIGKKNKNCVAYLLCQAYDDLPEE